MTSANPPEARTKYNMELVSKLRKLTADEFAELENLCLENGIDPIKVWGDYLIDGRHRVRIADKHNLVCPEQQMGFRDIDEAKAYIYRLQAGRRNLTEVEMQRNRAELARLTSIEEAAETHGVSERTIQRDMAMANAMNLMEDDLREKCESGAIINSRGDWKRYGELTDHERKAVDKKLRGNPELTLRDALPEKAPSLSQDDMDIVNSCNQLSGRVKQMFASGSIAAKPSEVQRMANLPPEKQVLLSNILEDAEVTSLRQALQSLSEIPDPKTPEDIVGRAKLEMKQIFERLQAKLDDIGVTGVNCQRANKLLAELQNEVDRM